ncbi:G-protein coupled receptor 39 [Callorhinchus milii]|uniref:G protein-coupled receptor 39 n=1 Tax=Callorhinchus milii TaxID=7868 RepID=K4FYF7_CALMI|nr:G-protein coupled receptor 39 [Callorhinchus milii]AFK11297.1 G-protein coupled receptor 39-like protein [Callorhinchus milii]|eukprot:gi/632957245/ref/XP_007894373.1/ PREDICTED: G-protein coupled receptor 39 [Callorhinchus milii]
MTADTKCKDHIDHKDVLDFEATYSVKIGLTILYSLILVAGIIGNSLTIKVVCILQNKGYLLKSVTDHMISLSCSDLLVLILGMPVELYSVIWDPFSSSGNIHCKVYNFLFEACSYATILHVATLSFERYIAICHPFKYKSFSGSRTVKLMCFVWLTSFCTALPLLFAMGAEDPMEPFKRYSHTFPSCNRGASNKTICTNLTSKYTVFQLSVYSAFIMYILILASVTFMCKMMSKTMIRMSSGTVSSKANQGKHEILPKHESAEKKSARKQTIVFLVLIVITLAVCWMPLQIRRIMAASKPKDKWTKSYFRAYIILMPISDTFFYLSSVINPLLYNLSSKQFRSVFMQVLRCKVSLEHVNMRTLRKHTDSSQSSTARSTRQLLHASRKYTRPPKRLTSLTKRDTDSDQCQKVSPTEPDSELTQLNPVSMNCSWKIDSDLTLQHIAIEPNRLQPNANGLSETAI